MREREHVLDPAVVDLESQIHVVAAGTVEVRNRAGRDDRRVQQLGVDAFELHGAVGPVDDRRKRRRHPDGLAAEIQREVRRVGRPLRRDLIQGAGVRALGRQRAADAVDGRKIRVREGVLARDWQTRRVFLRPWARSCRCCRRGRSGSGWSASRETASGDRSRGHRRTDRESRRRAGACSCPCG